MKCLMLAVAAMGLAAFGCEEKKADVPKPAVPATTTNTTAPSTTDSMKAAADKSAGAMKDAAKSTGDAMKSGMDKTKEAGASAVNAMGDKANAALGGEVSTMVAKAKAQLDQLNAGGMTLTGPAKTDFTASVAPLNDQYKGLADQVSKLSTMSGDALTKSFAEIKDRGNKLMDGIKTVAAKYNIKLTA